MSPSMERHHSPSTRFFGEAGSTHSWGNAHTSLGASDFSHAHTPPQLLVDPVDVAPREHTIAGTYHGNGAQSVSAEAGHDDDHADQRQLIAALHEARKMQSQLNAVADAINTQSLAIKNGHGVGQLPAAHYQQNGFVGMVPDMGGGANVGSGAFVMVPWMLPLPAGNAVEVTPKGVPPFHRRKYPMGGNWGMPRPMRSFDGRVSEDQCLQPIIQGQMPQPCHKQQDCINSFSYNGHNSYDVQSHSNRGGNGGGVAAAAFKRHRPLGPKRGHARPKGGVVRGNGDCSMPEPPASVPGPLRIFVDLSLLSRVDNGGGVRSGSLRDAENAT